jgi:NAD(P)-dependent dehydrogenase (short-subunit alcohol dehydrogenase family)
VSCCGPLVEFCGDCRAIAFDAGCFGRSRRGASSREGADRVAEIAGKGGKAIAMKADVSKAADVQRLFDPTKKVFGSLDVLVNNAGVYGF